MRPRRAGSAWQLIGFAIIGALVVFVAGYLLMFTDLLPAPGADETEDAVAATGDVAADVTALRDEIATLTDRLAQQSAAFDAALDAAIAGIAVPDLAPLDNRIAALEAEPADEPPLAAEVQALANAVSAVEADIAEAQQAREALAQLVDDYRFEAIAEGAVAGDPEAAARLSADLAVLSQRIAVLEAEDDRNEIAALGAAIDGMRLRIAALEDALNDGALSSFQAELAALGDELAVLSEQTAAIAANAETLDQTRAAARSLAIANLGFVVESGRPFVAELAMLSELGIEADGLAPLDPFARSGVASVAMLADSFPAVADAILSAEREADPDAGFWDRLWDNARGAILIEPAEPTEGTDPPAIVSRMRAAVAEGDLATALTERAGLNEAGLAASAAWAAEAERRVALDTALTEIAETVFRSEAR